MWWEEVQQRNTALFTKCWEIHIYITISTLLHHSLYNKIGTQKILAVHTQESSIHYPEVPKEYMAVLNNSMFSLKNNFDQSYKPMNNFTALKIRALTHSCITNSAVALQIILWGFLFNRNSLNYKKINTINKEITVKCVHSVSMRILTCSVIAAHNMRMLTSAHVHTHILCRMNRPPGLTDNRRKNARISNNTTNKVCTTQIST